MILASCAQQSWLNASLLCRQSSQILIHHPKIRAWAKCHLQLEGQVIGREILAWHPKFVCLGGVCVREREMCLHERAKETFPFSIAGSRALGKEIDALELMIILSCLIGWCSLDSCLLC